jgi:hypothetical protein
MNTEDEYLEELIRRDNTISFIKQRLEETSEKLEAEKKLVQEKDNLILGLAKTLKENNVPIEIIMGKTN